MMSNCYLLGTKINYRLLDLVKYFEDMLDSGKIPVIELTEIYRQSAGSTIIEMAHMIKRSEWTDDITKKTSDRSFIKAGSDRILEVVEQVVKNAIAKGSSH